MLLLHLGRRPQNILAHRVAGNERSFRGADRDSGAVDAEKGKAVILRLLGPIIDRHAHVVADGASGDAGGEALIQADSGGPRAVVENRDVGEAEIAAFPGQHAGRLAVLLAGSTGEGQVANDDIRRPSDFEDRLGGVGLNDSPCAAQAGTVAGQGQATVDGPIARPGINDPSGVFLDGFVQGGIIGSPNGIAGERLLGTDGKEEDAEDAGEIFHGKWGRRTNVTEPRCSRWC